MTAAATRDRASALPRGSLRLRLLSGTLVWIAASIVVAGWGLSNLFHRHVEAQFYAELQTLLYARIQANENPDFVELLAWSFVQRKDYKSALRQYKALDKRLDEPGQRIFKLANDAANAKDYDQGRRLRLAGGVAEPRPVALPESHGTAAANGRHRACRR